LLTNPADDVGKDPESLSLQETGKLMAAALSTSLENESKPTAAMQSIAFLALVIIHSLQMLFFKLSQNGGKYKYNTASAIAITECVKFVMSLISHIRTMPEDAAFIPEVSFFQHCGWLVLAIGYCVNNQLTFFMFLSLGPGQAAMGKAFAPMLTAMIMWVLFDEQISRVQWVIIVLLACGLLQVFTSGSTGKSGASVNSSALISLACFITSFTSVSNAKLIQKGGTPMHFQNMLLYSNGFVLSIVAYWFGFSASSNASFFEGMSSPAVIVMILTQSFLGIVITFVFKFGGALVKVLAGGAQAAILFILDGILFGVPIDSSHAVGAVVVILSSWLYFTVALSVGRDDVFCHGIVSSVCRALWGTAITLAFIGMVISQM
jgi:drug/metabolite transporter (DMT)-like permease